MGRRIGDESFRLTVVVERKLNRRTIGTAICHALILRDQYGIEPSRAIVCEKSDAALKAVCDAHDITVHVVEPVDHAEEDEDDG